MKKYEEIEVQYAPMISAVIRKLHIYRDHESFRQIGKIALWQAFLRFEESKGNFTAFAYRSIYGAMIDELKKESKFTTRFLVMENQEFEWIIAQEEENTLPEWIEELSLKGEEKLLLEELFINGKSVAELAEMSGLSLAGMKKRRERLLKKMKGQLLKEGTEESYKLYGMKEERNV